MLKFSILLVTSVTFSSFAQNVHILKIHPIDFIGDPKEFPSDVEQMEAYQGQIYLRSKNDSVITVIDKKGNLLTKIGGLGMGPGELSQGALAIGLYRDHLWVQDVNRRSLLQHYVNGKYVGYLLIQDGNLSSYGIGSNVFAVAEDRIVFPTSPRNKALAEVVFFNGKSQFVGDLLFDQGDEALLRRLPGMNDSYWVYDELRFYSLLRFFPQILVFERDFSLLPGIGITLPLIQNLYEERIINWKPKGPSSKPIPLFYDFKICDDHLYVMASKTFLRINKITGDISDIYRFRGFGPDFSEVDGHFLNFKSFVVLEGGTVILSGAYAWEHDLWYAEIPNFK